MRILNFQERCDKFSFTDSRKNITCYRVWELRLEYCFQKYFCPTLDVPQYFMMGE